VAVREEHETLDGANPRLRTERSIDLDRVAPAARLGTPSATMASAMPVTAVPVTVTTGTAPTTTAPTEPEGDEGTFRHAYSRDRSVLIRRLRRIEGQVRGIERMIEREEYCVDILQQTAALRAAVDSVALLVLEDHVQGCVRTVAEQGDADRYIEEVLDVVRRMLGKPVRNPRA
jgi:DNA-binding FrmR family transcriptional regulator